MSVTIRETADQGDRRRAIIVASGRVTLRLPESELAALIAEGMLARIKRARREHEHDAECADDYELEHDRDLADRIAALLEAEGGLPALQIARKVRRRRADVIAVLHSDARFDRTGTGRGTRWTAAGSSGRRSSEQARPLAAPRHRLALGVPAPVARVLDLHPAALARSVGSRVSSRRTGFETAGTPGGAGSYSVAAGAR